jgi:hypothetical protein
MHVGYHGSCTIDALLHRLQLSALGFVYMVKSSLSNNK